jgi:DNA-binding LytR/AlgR family response regulator
VKATGGSGPRAPSRPGLRVLAIDDELPALQDLARMLASSPQVAVVEAARSAGQALRLLAERRFDALFLDVRMPGMGGLELAGVLDRFAEPPALVFVSAYEDGAVGAFERELRPIDYLMKPVSRRRIEQALERVRGERIRGGPPAAPQPPAATAADEIIPIDHHRGGGTRLLQRSSVLYLQAEGDYVRIVADAGRFLVRGALAELERRWAEHGFVRVHRSFLVNLRRAVEIRPELGGGATMVLSDGSEVPVARRQVPELRRRLGL